MEAISHAGTCLGILAKDGILLAAERRNTNKLLDGAIFSEKIYKLNEWVVVVVKRPIRRHEFTVTVSIFSVIWCARWPALHPMPMYWQMNCEWLPNATNWIMANRCHANNWSRICVISNRRTPSTVVKDHLAYPFCTWDGTNITATNCINQIRVETMEDGRLHALETIPG